MTFEWVGVCVCVLDYLVGIIKRRVYGKRREKKEHNERNYGYNVAKGAISFCLLAGSRQDRDRTIAQRKMLIKMMCVCVLCVVFMMGKTENRLLTMWFHKSFIIIVVIVIMVACALPLISINKVEGNNK